MDYFYRPHQTSRNGDTYGHTHLEQESEHWTVSLALWLLLAASMGCLAMLFVAYGA